MDSSRASSSIQLIQLPNVHHQDVEQTVQPSHRPVVTGGFLSDAIEEQLPPRPDPSPVPETSGKAWLAVAGAFCYLFPTYGKRDRTSLCLYHAC